jgi:hypothetical protein
VSEAVPTLALSAKWPEKMVSDFRKMVLDKNLRLAYCIGVMKKNQLSKNYELFTTNPRLVIQTIKRQLDGSYEWPRGLRVFRNGELLPATAKDMRKLAASLSRFVPASGPIPSAVKTKAKVSMWINQMP